MKKRGIRNILRVKMRNLKKSTVGQRFTGEEEEIF